MPERRCLMAMEGLSDNCFPSMVRRRFCALSRTMRPHTRPSRRGENAAQGRGSKSLDRDVMTSTSLETGSAPNAPLEKVALETYVPPAKPSLVGLSRGEIADRL